MKKLWISMMVSVMTLGACAAPVSKTTTAVSEETSSPVKTGDEKVVLKLYANYSADQEIRTLDYALSEMKKIMPNVEVEIEPVAQDDGQKLKTYAASGNLPDIFDVSGVNIELFNKSDALMELDSYVQEAGIEDALVESYKKSLYMSDGHIYAVPWQSPWVNSFYANKAVFDECGLELPRNYEEFLEAVKVFQEKGILPYALFGKEKAWCLHLYDIMVTRREPSGIAGLDAGEHLASEEAYVEAAKDLVALVDAGMLSKDVFNTTYDQAEALFTSGKAAIFMTGTWALNGLEEKMGEDLAVLYYPLAKAGTEEESKWNMSGGYSQGGFAVPKYSENAEIAAEFAVNLSQKLNEGFVVLEGGASIYKEYPKSQTELGPVMQSYIDDNANFKSMSAFDWNLQNQELKTVLEDKSQELLTGSLSVENFAKEIDYAIEEIKNR